MRDKIDDMIMAKLIAAIILWGVLYPIIFVFLTLKSGIPSAAQDFIASIKDFRSIWDRL